MSTGRAAIAPYPGHVAQPHQGDPAQTAGLDQLLATGTHRVAIDGPRFDLGAATPFQGFVNAEDQRAVTPIQVLEQQHQQDAGHLARRPNRPLEHLMVADVVPVVAESHDAERRSYGALAWGQYRADQQDFGFGPVGLRNSVAKGLSTGTIALGRVSIAWLFSRRVRPAYRVLTIAIALDSIRTNWYRRIVWRLPN